jgi:cell division protein ZapA
LTAVRVRASLWAAVKRTVTIDIAGAKYRMTSDADEAHLRRLAELVDERIEALGPRALRTAAPTQLLAVVALGLADDLLAAEQRSQKLEHVTREVIGKAIARIDERLEADAALAAKAEGA